MVAMVISATVVMRDSGRWHPGRTHQERRMFHETEFGLKLSSTPPSMPLPMATRWKLEVSGTVTVDCYRASAYC